MITFQSVKWKNMLSTGNNWSEVDLQSHGTTLIVGDNGAGKSTMLDAISFVLYGKPFRKINKPQLINSINKKGLEVEVRFAIGQKSYRVRRGIKPNIFEVWCDEELLNQDAAARDYQAYLEENVLKLNHKSFGQVVVLGSSTFVPFMQLAAASRRSVIEDLLDIQIFTTMNTLLKDRISNNKVAVSENNHEIELLRTRIDSARSHNNAVRKIKQSEVGKLKARLKEQVALAQEEKKTVDSLMDRVEELANSIQDKPSIKGKLTKLQDVRRDLVSRRKTLSSEIDFFNEHEDCPTCRQGIDQHFRDEKCITMRNRIGEIDDAFRQLDPKIEAVEKRLSEIDEIESEITSINLQAGTHRSNERNAIAQCKEIHSDLKSAQKDVKEIDTSEIESLEQDLNSLHSRQSELHGDRETLGVIGTMLKDGGIKTQIVKQYIPVMNKLINKYLAAMDFFVQFELDESFNETIKSRFRDEFSYASFSEGEKTRIDLALLMTWRSIARLRNSVSTNLLIMDEIFDGSLDMVGSDSLISIIKEVSADSNVFVISHRSDQRVDEYDRIIKFEKVKNFSSVTVKE